jgi:hypothetical protein
MRCFALALCLAAVSAFVPPATLRVARPAVSSSDVAMVGKVRAATSSVCCHAGSAFCVSENG